MHNFYLIYCLSFLFLYPPTWVIGTFRLPRSSNFLFLLLFFFFFSFLFPCNDWNPPPPKKEEKGRKNYRSHFQWRKFREKNSSRITSNSRRFFNRTNSLRLSQRSTIDDETYVLRLQVKRVPDPIATASPEFRWRGSSVEAEPRSPPTNWTNWNGRSRGPNTRTSTRERSWRRGRN